MNWALSREQPIAPERIQQLNDREVQPGEYVIYWMQASQRAADNHALEYAVRRANRLGVPLLVVFGLTGDYPEANARHYRFMLEGLRETRHALRKRGIRMVIRYGSPARVAAGLAGAARLMVTDRGYTRIQRAWRREVAEAVSCPVFQVETDVVVPVEVASSKREYAARTLRPKIHRFLDTFLQALPGEEVRHPFVHREMPCGDLSDIPGVLAELRVDPSVGPSEFYRGGTANAEARLEAFLREKLTAYAADRNNPAREACSHLSPYLHFGQISPVSILRQVRATGSPSVETFLEELVVRRELSMNFCYYTEDYDAFSCLPRWARETLLRHAKDEREHLYSPEEFERGLTHDPYWNAAQQEMVITGKMHGYMRMYWGKKILEWTAHPETAYEIALHLNNKYELDGRDPNGYAGVAWCFGNHDQAWKERPVYGKVRYMNANGLRRKFPIENYVERIHRLQRT